MYQLVDMRDFVAGERKGQYTLFPYAKELFYHPGQEILSMTIEMYDEKQTQEFSFGFKVSDKLKEFLEMTAGDNNA